MLTCARSAASHLLPAGRHRAAEQRQLGEPDPLAGLGQVRDRELQVVARVGLVDARVRDRPVVVLAHGVRVVVHRRAGRLRRTRHVVRAVDAISFTVARGEAVGYIGANGAGKSTTIKMLTGILTPTAGEVRSCGLHPVRRLYSGVSGARHPAGGCACSGDGQA